MRPWDSRARTCTSAGPGVRRGQVDPWPNAGQWQLRPRCRTGAPGAGYGGGGRRPATAALVVRERERDSARSRLADPAALGAGRCCETVRAPVGGRVLKVTRESAQLPSSGKELLLEIGDPADMDVVVELLSSDAVQVRVGSPATIRISGDPPARVSRIEPAGFTKVSALGIEEQRRRQAAARLER